MHMLDKLKPEIWLFQTKVILFLLATPQSSTELNHDPVFPILYSVSSVLFDYTVCADTYACD